MFSSHVVANLKIGAIYALFPESFCDKNLAIWKVFAFCDTVCDTGVDNIGLPVIMTILEWTILQWTILEWAILEWTILGYLWSWQYRSKPYWEVTCDHDNAGGRSPLFGRHTAWETRPATAGHPWTATLGAQLSNTPAGHFKNHEQSSFKGPWFQAAYFD